MIDRTLITLLAGCVLFAGIIALELQPSDSKGPLIVAPEASAETKPLSPAEQPAADGLIAIAKARPLFSATRRPAEKAAPNSAGDTELSDVRLAGIIVDPERHMAIFAISGAKPLVRLEGETVKEWRLDSISPDEVSLSGPAGVRTLAPKADPHLVRQIPAVLAAPAAATATARAVPNPAGSQPAPAGRPPFPIATTAQPAPNSPAPPQAVTGPPPIRAPNLAPMPRPPNGPRPPQ